MPEEDDEMPEASTERKRPAAAEHVKEEKRPEPNRSQWKCPMRRRRLKRGKQKHRRRKRRVMRLTKRRILRLQFSITIAIELDHEDISFITNRAAVYLEMGKYEDCIKDCDTAVEKGRELRSDFKMIARALTRKGTALAKLAKTSKDFEVAIEAKKELEQQEYFNPQLADEDVRKFFKEMKYPGGGQHYTESIKRNPKDPRAYSNRAACYTEGLKLDPQNQELLDGVKRCVGQINKASRGDLTPEELKERQAKGMQDPEIQNILTDPVMRQVINWISRRTWESCTGSYEEPSWGMDKIQKLINAGIVQVR
ncbi:hypothetical protein HAX54_021282 [Datura stramonium]|uniref:Uncharacterized protein n=1 Tax=Datura stramonium TaxID=4076 RepID=A0ABS8S424_DATST|nr:hypothetical protein [Datura stramonium]